MDDGDFRALISGLGDALLIAKGETPKGARIRKVEVTRSFVAETRIKAGLTQQEFAAVTGASLGAVRKWERGERSPSGAAQMLVRVMARAPELVIDEAGLKARRKRNAP